MQQVKAVVARAKGAPVSGRDDQRPRPGPGRGAWCRCRPAGSATPTCTTARAASTTTSRSCSATRPPASSRRSATTSPSVAPGDFVILNWRAVCGNCRACTRGEPWYCFATHNATQKMTLEDGTELSPALGIGAFAEKTLVAAGQCTKVDPSARAGRGRPARLRRDGRPRRRDQHRQRRAAASRVAVIGCGGVGAAAIAGSRAGRRRARSSPSTSTTGSSRAPRELGATHTVNSKDADPVEAIQELTGGNGADVVIDAVGRPRPGSRRSTPATWPAPSCWSACRPRT